MSNKLVFVLFTVLQVADGILTYCGITHTPLGTDYEATPHIAFLMQAIGVFPALLLVKSIAVALGAVLFYSIDHIKLPTIDGLPEVAMIFLTVLMGIIFIKHIMTLSVITGISTVGLR